MKRINLRDEICCGTNIRDSTFTNVKKHYKAVVLSYSVYNSMIPFIIALYSNGRSIRDVILIDLYRENL